jgi:hypothetical protein
MLLLIQDVQAQAADPVIIEKMSRTLVRSNVRTNQRVSAVDTKLLALIFVLYGT